MIDIAPFKTHRWLQNGHVMTVVAWAKRRRFPSLPAPDSAPVQSALMSERAAP